MAISSTLDCHLRLASDCVERKLGGDNAYLDVWPSVPVRAWMLKNTGLFSALETRGQISFRGAVCQLSMTKVAENSAWMLPFGTRVCVSVNAYIVHKWFFFIQNMKNVNLIFGHLSVKIKNRWLRHFAWLGVCTAWSSATQRAVCLWGLVPYTDLEHVKLGSTLFHYFSIMGSTILS